MTTGSQEPVEVMPYAVLIPLAPWEQPSILSQALLSLEAQSWPPGEVVVSCDGPPPPELRAAFDQSKLPIQLILGPGGEGVGPVLARGLCQCKQDLIVRADADDLSTPERCATQLQWLKRHPQVIALGCVIDEFLSPSEALQDIHAEESYGQLRIISSRWVPSSPQEIRRLAFSRNPINHPSVVFRRPEVLAVGNYRSRPGFEDYDLWLRILSTYGPDSLANLPASLVLARVGEAHLRRRHGWSYAVDEIRFFWACWKERLLPLQAVVRALLIRIPLRLMPAKLLAVVMYASTRRAVLPGNGKLTSHSAS